MILTVIGIAPASERERRASLFDALEQLFPVSFQGRALGEFDGLHALILPDSNQKEALAAAQRGIKCLAVQLTNPAVVREGDAVVQFSNSEALPPVLRGQTVREPSGDRFVSLTVQPRVEVVALKDDRIVWVHRRGTATHGDVDLVSLSLPDLPKGGYLREFFNGNRFLGLLPLISFLQRVTARSASIPSPLRACFVFDDPNLRRPSYGCIRFSELAEHARTRNYHVAVGFIPLDGDSTDAGTAALFRENSAHLSLVMHGNDHVYLEMARRYPEAEQIAILAQALRRVVKFERRFGTKVCRVMESPYGVITCNMFRPLLSLGYEAVALTPLQFPHCSYVKPFPLTIGSGVAETLDGGLCLMPRIPMSPQWKADVLLAAVLGQPIVIVGHHYNAAGNLGLVDEVVETVNGLGSVRWCSLSGIARTNYAMREEGKTMIVRMGSRRIDIEVPKHIENVRIERPWLSHDQKELLTINGLNSAAMASQIIGSVSDPVRVAGLRSVEILSPVPGIINPESIPLPNRRLWPVLRRLLTEARDRAYPHLHRFSTERALCRKAARKWHALSCPYTICPYARPELP